MRQGTTPTLTLAVKGVDLTDMSVHVYIRQGTVIIEREGVECSWDGTHSIIDVTLTQDETLSLAANRKADIQVRFISQSGAAGATDIASTCVARVLKKEVISYE